MSENNQKVNPEQTTEKDLNMVMKVRREKLKTLQDEGTNPFDVTKFDRDNCTTQIRDNYADFEGKIVTLAGRIMSKRVMGKMSFADIRD
ncbi:MAG: lysine--tRNA ligase, partial [Oscillospiraceae bacterium]